jgi:hypothetical protein
VFRTKKRNLIFDIHETLRLSRKKERKKEDENEW